MDIDRRRPFPLIDAIAVVFWTLMILACIGGIVGGLFFI